MPALSGCYLFGFVPLLCALHLVPYTLYGKPFIFLPSPFKFPPLKQLKALNHYFWKYRYRLCLGILFIIISNYFAVLAPQVTGYVFDVVQQAFGIDQKKETVQYDWLVNWFIHFAEQHKAISVIAFCGITILVLALIRGVFMFLMRQTIIV